MKLSDIDFNRFLSKIDLQLDGCWNWKGGINSDGYGNFHYKGKTRTASRIAYGVFYGDLDNNLLVCHHCDNPKCVNPDHLYLGTQKDNAKDRVKRKRYKDITGINNPCAKLSEIKVYYIKALLRHNIQVKRIAEEFEVSTATIYNIKNNEYWK